jgi:hypothetical protein
MSIKTDQGRGKQASAKLAEVAGSIGSPEHKAAVQEKLAQMRAKFRSANPDLPDGNTGT